MSVYFMRMGEGGPIKIGYASDVYRRRLELQTAVASEIKVLSYIDGDEETEAEIHAKFDHLRLRGELFRPADDLLAHIEALPPIPPRMRKVGRNGGRPMEYPVRLTLPLTDETVARLDAVREEGEARLDVIRAGVERELKAREKGAGRGQKSP